jgi:hypothetical protein
VGLILTPAAAGKLRRERAKQDSGRMIFGQNNFLDDHSARQLFCHFVSSLTRQIATQVVNVSSDRISAGLDRNRSLSHARSAQWIKQLRRVNRRVQRFRYESHR